MSDIDWDLITRYLGGACTPSERGRVERWLAESPRHRSVADALRALAADGDAKAPPVWKAAVAKAIRDKAAALRPITSPEPPPPGAPGRAAPARPRLAIAHRRRTFFEVWIAATFLLVVGGTLLGPRLLRMSATRPVSSLPERVLSTARGQRLALRLPDGTAVSLAPGSRLRIAPGFGASERMVSLEGEAAFTVTHDAGRPFTVHTARAVARDLGTRFVVRAYSGDSSTDVVVADGLVAVARAPAPERGTAARAGGRPRASPDSLVLARGERARLTDDGRVEHARGVELDPYFAWSEGRLVFRDTPLREAAARLGRWYDADVRVASPAVGARPLTASVLDEPIGDVLSLIAATLDLTLTRDGTIYTLGEKPARPLTETTR